MRTRILLLVLLAALPLPGCSPVMMPPPAIFAGGGVDAFFEVPEDRRESQVTVFYATDRLEDHPGWGNYGRGRGDRLDLGTCTVQFGGPDHWATLQKLTTAPPHPARPVIRVTRTDRLGDLYTTRTPSARGGPPDETAQQFLDQLQAALDASSGHEVTVYIHGFKNGFHQAVQTTAEYAHYAGNQGAFICYAWPSRNSLWAYHRDRDAAEFAATHLRRLVLFLAEHSSATRINFLCHSTGCQLLGTLLRELRLMAHDQTPDAAREHYRIGQVFLVAPDIDLTVARERILEEGAAGLCEHLTIYTSASDYALHYAGRHIYSAPRLGVVEDHMFSREDRAWLQSIHNLTVIDTGQRRTQTIIGHTHHRYNPVVSSDILLMLRHPLTHEERALERNAGEWIWKPADDYEQRIRASALRVYPAAP